MAGLARSPDCPVVDEFYGNGTSDASAAVLTSSRSRMEWNDLRTVAFPTSRRGSERGPQPWQEGGATPGLYVCRSRMLLLLGPNLLHADAWSDGEVV